LLSVIVILGIILVIAIPKIQEVIENSKKEFISSSVKVLAAIAEMEYAKRVAFSEDIDIELNGGSINNNPEGNYSTGTEIIIEYPTREGYKFTGWTVKGTGSILVGNEL